MFLNLYTNAENFQSYQNGGQMTAWAETTRKSKHDLHVTVSTEDNHIKSANDEKTIFYIHKRKEKTMTKTNKGLLLQKSPNHKNGEAAMTVKNIENAQLSILLEIDGKVHLVGMHKENLEAVQYLIKSSVEVVIPTNKSQQELRNFLEYNKGFPM